MIILENKKDYVIKFVGNINNIEEIKEKYNIRLENLEDILLELFLEYGDDFLKDINGEFSLCIKNLVTKDTFLIRDKLGVKPLYYTILSNGEIYVENRIDKLIKNTNITPIIDKEGVKMLALLGPAKEEGKTLFKNIYEVKPGCYNVYTSGKLIEVKYFDYINKINVDTKEEVKEKIKKVLEDSILKRCDKENVNVMLSGGLDSSIVTTVLYNNNKKINSYSVDYENNNINFSPNKFQKTQDKDFISKISDKTNSKHTNIIINEKQLIDNLREAVIARERPAMGDIDSSLLVFLKEMQKLNVNTCFTGECSDEIFLGYPWLYTECSKEKIPFINNIELRKKFIKKNILSENEIDEYINNIYYKYINDLKLSDVIDDKSKKFIKNNYLTIKLFMPVLIERAEKISNYLNMNLKIPFADYRIFEYLFNVPFYYKINNYYNEKSLLKEIYLDDLPIEIIKRKKSPYPKTYDPNYLESVQKILYEMLENENCKLKEIFDIEFIKEYIKKDGNIYEGPFFGQLMTYPQVLAYLIQIEMWMQMYNVHFENN